MSQSQNRQIVVSLISVITINTAAAERSCKQPCVKLVNKFMEVKQEKVSEAEKLTLTLADAFNQ